jgi:hypothetical protein
MNQLPLSLFVSVSALTFPAGLGAFNVNNILILSNDVPTIAPTNGFGVFSGSSGVVNAYGSDTETAAMAVALFGQSPNILAGGGQLVVAPLLQDLEAVTAVQKVSFSGTPASGDFELAYGVVGNTGSLTYTTIASALQVALRTITGLTSVTVSGGPAPTAFAITFTGVNGPIPNLLVSANTLVDSDGNSIAVTVSTTTEGVVSGSSETMINGILRLQQLVTFCGCMKTDTWVTNEIMDAATYVQTQNIIMGVQSNTSSDATATTGVLWQVMDAGLNQTRCTQYLLDTYQEASTMLAAYFGRAFCVDFQGSNTTINMQLKTLNGIEADSGMSEAQWEVCQAAGVDTYPSINGLAKVSTSGLNKFFDQVYNYMWLSTTVQIDVFNVIAETPTKVPQTDSGVGQLIAAMQTDFEQGVTNGYLAPGQWNGSTFGNQADFLRNITDVGFYIYAAPVAQQSQTVRATRAAPLIQAAAKEAGGINSASVQISILP